LLTRCSGTSPEHTYCIDDSPLCRQRRKLNFIVEEVAGLKSLSPGAHPLTARSKLSPGLGSLEKQLDEFRVSLHDINVERRELIRDEPTVSGRRN
jgi:hypothetical protein